MDAAVSEAVVDEHTNIFTIYGAWMDAAVVDNIVPCAWIDPLFPRPRPAHPPPHTMDAAVSEAIVDEHFTGTYRIINGGTPHDENIASNVTQLIGWTPLVELKNIARKEGAVARIVGKLECQQPLGSVKDRIGLPMIEDAEKRGLIKPGVSTLVEPTSGNTAIALACAGIHKNYKVAAVMPASSSIERRMILRALGADVYLTDPALGFPGVFAKSDELLASLPNSYMLNQLANASNPEAHYRTTGPEVWRDTAGKVDIFMAGSGTGGTFSGAGRFLKEQNPAIKVMAVEPAESAVLSGKCKGPHKIQGIGPGFIPENTDVSVADEIVTVTSEEAMTFALRLAKEEGVLVGPSSGAAFAAALKVAMRPENVGKLIVTILPSGGERYLTSDLFASIREECNNMTY